MKQKLLDELTREELISEYEFYKASGGFLFHLVTHEILNRDPCFDFHMMSWSYADYVKGLPQESEHSFKLPDGISVRVKECKCESRHLFAFGHENKCDYYEEKKR